jgi:hypothetical protein
MLTRTFLCSYKEFSCSNVNKKQIGNISSIMVALVPRPTNRSLAIQILNHIFKINH